MSLVVFRCKDTNIVAFGDSRYPDLDINMESQLINKSVGKGKKTDKDDKEQRNASIAIQEARDALSEVNTPSVIDEENEGEDDELERCFSFLLTRIAVSSKE